MNEKIEEMVLAVYPWLKEVPIEERKQLRENVSGLMVMERIYNAGYRKESDTAREICDLILEYWKVDAFVDCSWVIEVISEKYGVDLGE